MTHLLNTTSATKIAALESIRSKSQASGSGAQCKRLLEGLGQFGLNTFEAMRYLDVYHVPARILQLRKRGHKITTHWQTVATESGHTHRVGLYVLESAVLDADRTPSSEFVKEN